jgi:SAM-dependent methyltransferase
MGNPWLHIPAVDYEGHMGSPDVDQLSFLGRTFKQSLENYDCDTVALLGCATGNGLEYINTAATRKVTAIDINSEYLEILRQRFEKSVPGLETVDADLETAAIGNQVYSLVFAGLIFEYLDPRKVLPSIAGSLRPGRVLVAVLQLPAVHLNKITETPYASIKKLESIMRLISPQDFKLIASEAGLKETEGERVTLESGKSFYIGTYTKCNLGRVK